MMRFFSFFKKNILVFLGQRNCFEPQNIEHGISNRRSENRRDLKPESVFTSLADSHYGRLSVLGIFVLLMFVAVFSVGCSKKHESGSRYIDSPLVKEGAVTLVELGALSCKPCQMMFPIMEELTTEYAGRADIQFINVHEDETAARTFAIMVIPTQIIYDRQRKEVFRHVGFIEKEPLAKELDKLL